MPKPRALFDYPTPTERAWAVERTRFHILEAAEQEGHTNTPDLPLTRPSETWLDRMCTALVDQDCSQKSFDELEEAFCACLEKVSLLEADELRRRLIEYEFVNRSICEATSVDPAPPTLELVGPRHLEPGEQV